VDSRDSIWRLKIFTFISLKRAPKKMMGSVTNQHQANKTYNDIYKSKQNCSRVRYYKGVEGKQDAHATMKAKTWNKNANERNGMRYHRRQQCQHR